MANRPDIPKEVTRAVFIECGHRCAVCGTPFPLERAHIIPWNKSKDHRAENLICLCSNCHTRSHTELWDTKTLQEYKKRPWVNRQHSPPAEIIAGSTQPPREEQPDADSVSASPVIPEVVRMNVRLSCCDQYTSALHMRPGAYIALFCASFPESHFNLVCPSGDSVDPKNLVGLVSAGLAHGDELILEVSGRCRLWAATALKVVLENMDNFADDAESAKKRIRVLGDEAFAKITDPDISAADQPIMSAPVLLAGHANQECRSVAIINDRLHNLSLAILPEIARHFTCSATLAFEDPKTGVYWFTLSEETRYELDQKIMDLSIEVGTSITVLTSGAERYKANQALKSVLDHLWQCDTWLRKQSANDRTAPNFIKRFLHHVDELRSTRGAEFAYAHDPLLSSVLSSRRIFVNDPNSDFSQDDVINQLAIPHAIDHNLDIKTVIAVSKSVPMRMGLSLVHSALDDGPRISLSLGVYPNGVKWHDADEDVKLVCMFVFAKDAYRTWLDFMRKFAKIFRDNRALKDQLVSSQNADDLLNRLSRAETRSRS